MSIHLLFGPLIRGPVLFISTPIHEMTETLRRIVVSWVVVRISLGFIELLLFAFGFYFESLLPIPMETTPVDAGVVLCYCYSGLYCHVYYIYYCFVCSVMIYLFYFSLPYARLVVRTWRVVTPNFD
jgi:hypothetical protein